MPSEDTLRNFKPPNNSPCCGAAKTGHVPDGRFLNPLNLPMIRLFSFRSEDGKILPDELACEQTGINIENVQFTIQTLGLNFQRLRDQRLAVIEEIEADLNEQDDSNIDVFELEKKVAAFHLGDGLSHWKPFFTTWR